MASTASSLRVALAIAVCVVLLHPSTGQQPAPALALSPSDCNLQCSSNCTQSCQAIADSDASKCNATKFAVYETIFKVCTNRSCNGNSYARGTCVIGSCSPSTCGCPCGRSCCESSTVAALDIYFRCMAPVQRVMQFCMPSCVNFCVNNNCGNGAASPTTSTAPAPPA